MSRRKNELEPRTQPKMLFEEYINPLDGETANGEFIYTNKPVLFKGEKYPAHFRITALDYDVLQQNECIGDTRLGEKLYWMFYSIVIRG